MGGWVVGGWWVGWAGWAGWLVGWAGWAGWLGSGKIGFDAKLFRILTHLHKNISNLYRISNL